MELKTLGSVTDEGLGLLEQLARCVERDDGSGEHRFGIVLEPSEYGVAEGLADRGYVHLGTNQEDGISKRTASITQTGEELYIAAEKLIDANKPSAVRSELYDIRCCFLVNNPMLRYTTTSRKYMAITIAKGAGLVVTVLSAFRFIYSAGPSDASTSVKIGIAGVGVYTIGIVADYITQKIENRRHQKLQR